MWKDWPDGCEAEIEFGTSWPDYFRIKVLTLRGRSFWSMHCRDIGLDAVPLKAKTLTEAKIEALTIVRQRLTTFLSLLPSES